MLGGSAAKRGADCQSLAIQGSFDSRLGLTWGDPPSLFLVFPNFWFSLLWFRFISFFIPFRFSFHSFFVSFHFFFRFIRFSSRSFRSVFVSFAPGFRSFCISRCTRVFGYISAFSLPHPGPIGHLLPVFPPVPEQHLSDDLQWDQSA